MDQKPFSKKVRVLIFYQDKKILDESFLKGPIYFGRGTEAEISLDYNFLSRKHGRIIQEGPKFYLEDLRSRNGLQVANQWIDKIEITPPFSFHIDRLRGEIFFEDIKEIFEATQLGPQDPVTQVPPLHPSSNVMSNVKNHVQRTTKSVVKESEPEQQLAKSPVAASRPSRPSPSASLSPSPIHHGELTEFHPGVRVHGPKKLEAVLLWQDQVIEVKAFSEGEKIYIGPSLLANIPVPTLKKGWALARVEKNLAVCFLPSEKEFRIGREGYYFSNEELVQSQYLQKKKKGFSFRLSHLDVVEIQLGSNLKLCLRWMPRSSRLKQTHLMEPDVVIKQSLFVSMILHGAFSLLLMLTTPPAQNIPKLKDVPERYARLLVDPPSQNHIQDQDIISPVSTTPATIAKSTWTPSTTLADMSPVEELTSEELTALETEKKVTHKTANATNVGPKPKKNINKYPNQLPPKKNKISLLPMESKSENRSTSSVFVMTNRKLAQDNSQYGPRVKALGLSTMRQEGLGTQAVLTAVNHHNDEFLDCYLKNLRTHSQLFGIMELEWEISADGEVESIRIKKSTLTNGEPLAECIKEVFMLMKFPKATNAKGTQPSMQLEFTK